MTAYWQQFLPHTLFCLAILLGAQPEAVRAQRQILRNPVDPTDLWITTVNPAAVSFQHSQVALGVEVLHAGFVPGQVFGLHENRLSLSLPYWLPWDLATGVEVRVFNASLYREIEANWLLSRKVRGPLALGLRLGLENRAFNAGEFKLVDPDDPLLAPGRTSRLLPSLGAGLYWQQERWALGAAMDHLDQPNIATGGQARLPRAFSAAVSCHIGNFTPSLVWNSDGRNSLLGINVSASLARLVGMRAGFEPDGPFRVESQFHFNRDSRLAYAVNFPTEEVSGASAGTHQLAFGHIFGREPDSGPPVLSMSSPHLQIIESRIQRTVDAGLTLAKLQDLPGLSRDFVDARQRLGNLVVIPVENGVALAAGGQVTASFRELGKHAALLQQSNPGVKLALRLPQEDPETTRRMRRLLATEAGVDPGHILVGYQPRVSPPSLEGFKAGATTVEQAAPSLTPATVTFTITVPGRRRIAKEWKLKILSATRQPVRVFSGSGPLPETLAWDWRTADGKVVSPGAYVAVLQVLSAQNKPYVSETPFQVMLIRREIKLHFRKPPAEDQPLQSHRDSVMPQAGASPQAASTPR
ncbi:MAG: type IX secretion system membrane protein PorP/SprF [candidate division KSB1 bacterium]|nr:type IX secretion system membrane protein PorP/SprF [candidate division KSB1 bacterium]MDZ7273942.1 type IX secretion system membrane protein PorP/SprF [candidate division KSB1 bacterium]MDZ7286098.1 type IX secretion system membrane protein PorP/SprF [candidate division KSB1 bacterium]MDZ7299130.1 type IX secretion system membrane protein PorP/SprF [candidate division KSB1 bacterium]MDZ7306677.1 type IX secretion system membrane protein PorP/SprF [candidate division KSB1 bacterium]